MLTWHNSCFGQIQRSESLAKYAILYIHVLLSYNWVVWGFSIAPLVLRLVVLEFMLFSPAHYALLVRYFKGSTVVVNMALMLGRLFGCVEYVLID